MMSRPVRVLISAVVLFCEAIAVAAQSSYADDFELRDDGVVQAVSEVELEQIPLNLLLVFDTSGSVAGEISCRGQG